MLAPDAVGLAGHGGGLAEGEGDQPPPHRALAGRARLAPRRGTVAPGLIPVSKPSRATRSVSSAADRA
jgi:hypothetical protein